MEEVLPAINLSRHYEMGHSVVRALDGVTLSVRPGEFFGLLGTSGSGKSTFLNLVGGLDRPSSGQLNVFDRDLALMSREELSRHRREVVGMVFQSFNLIGVHPIDYDGFEDTWDEWVARDRIRVRGASPAESGRARGRGRSR